MKKITKKDFIAKLQCSQNVIITAGSARNDKKEQIISALSSISVSAYKDFRTVKKTQSNGIQFFNDSWLYLDTVGRHNFYMYGSFLIAETVNNGFYSYVVYFVKPL